jgi:DNA helicase IV
VINHWAGTNWTIDFDGEKLFIYGSGKTQVIYPSADSSVSIKRFWFSKFLIHQGSKIIRVPGISKIDAFSVTFAREIHQVLIWFRGFTEVLNTARGEQRWIPQETIEELIHSRQEVLSSGNLDYRKSMDLVSKIDPNIFEALNLDIAIHIAEVNELILQQELTTQAGFLSRIETQPLTDEQARAVLTFDNRVQVVAAAGSGKTSVMVARTAYAVTRGFVSPKRILLLAFNKDAAQELQERVSQRLGAVGIDTSGIRASTFHSFGLDVIGHATGSKPRPAPWLDENQGQEVLHGIVNSLKISSPDFKYKWDFFRLLMANAPSAPDSGEPDSYDRTTKEIGLRTFDGKNVRSGGERLIANWLYLNGIEYKYEHPYSFRTASATHSQYRPDFYYPEADLWHEHWGLDSAGNPPPSFTGYLDDMEWKRQTHQSNGTMLAETTWFQIVHGSGFSELETQLNQFGIQTDWNPDRPKLGGEVIESVELCRLLRTFMAHVKSSKLDKEKIEQRLVSSHQSLAGSRTSLFLDIYWQVEKAWNQKLREEEYVDFEDMLSLAADHLETGSYTAPYDLILVDEFQDASQARARLVRGLVKEPNKYLLAVGDDWQAINRFAGADISVMTDFEDWFGAGYKLELTTTFRCSQNICDVSSSFVSKNPRQIRKVVHSVSGESGPLVQVMQSDDKSKAISQVLDKIANDARNHGTKLGIKKPSVFVLGRYGFDKDMLPKTFPENLKVSFKTIHKSKGLEADYVIIPNVSNEKYGFPSAIKDDPVLGLAMSKADNYENAEERRLFYVALTRAKSQVTIITTPGKESSFAVELLDNELVQLINREGETIDHFGFCPSCNKGMLVRRTGEYGDFLSCSRFPACKGKKSVRTNR